MVYTTLDKKQRRKYEIIFGKCHREKLVHILEEAKILETPTKKRAELAFIYECYMGNWVKNKNKGLSQNKKYTLKKSKIP